MENISLQRAYAALYRAFCKIKRLSYVDWKAFMDMTTIVRFKENEVMLEAGNLSTHSYFIIKGLVMCYEGHVPKVIKWFRAEHDHVLVPDKFKLGQLGRVNKLSLVALEDTLAFSIRHEDLDSLMDHHPMINRFYTALLFQYSVKMNQIANCLIVESRPRYEWIEEELGFKLNRIPDLYLAPYVGVTPKRLKELKKDRRTDFLTRY